MSAGMLKKVIVGVLLLHAIVLCNGSASHSNKRDSFADAIRASLGRSGRGSSTADQRPELGTEREREEEDVSGSMSMRSPLAGDRMSSDLVPEASMEVHDSGSERDSIPERQPMHLPMEPVPPKPEEKAEEPSEAEPIKHELRAFVTGEGGRIAAAISNDRAKAMSDLTSEMVATAMEERPKAVKKRLVLLMYQWRNVSQSDFDAARTEWLSETKDKVGHEICVKACFQMTYIFELVSWVHRLERVIGQRTVPNDNDEDNEDVYAVSANDFGEQMKPISQWTAEDFEYWWGTDKCEQSIAELVACFPEFSDSEELDTDYLRYLGLSEDVITKGFALIASAKADFAVERVSMAQNMAQHALGLAHVNQANQMRLQQRHEADIHALAQRLGDSTTGAKATKGKSSESKTNVVVMNVQPNSRTTRYVQLGTESEAATESEPTVTAQETNTRKRGRKVWDDTYERRRYWTREQRHKMWEMLLFLAILVFIGVSITVCVTSLCMPRHVGSGNHAVPLVAAGGAHV